MAEAPKIQHVLAVLISKQDTPSQGANPGRRSLILVDGTNQQGPTGFRDHSPGIKSKLALALRCSEASINRYIRENDDNLTLAVIVERHLTSSMCE